MRRAHWAWACLPLFLGCSFLLDFDKLQGGALPSSDAGLGDTVPDGSVSGTAGSAGGNGLSQDSALPCPTDCDDGDPCTDDFCTNGECNSVAAARIIPDGFEQSVSGSSIYRSALTAGTGQFYLAVYGDLASGQDIGFYSIPAEGDAWAQGPRATELSDLGTDLPISPPALVFDETANSLVAYFAVGPTSPANFFNAGRVLRASLSDTLAPVETLAVSADTNYRYINNTLGPTAAQVPNGDLFVTWPGATPPGTALTSGLYLQSGDTPLATTTAPQIWEPTDLRGLAPIYSLGNTEGLGRPGAVWVSQRANANQVDTHLQLTGGLRQTFGQCVNSGVQGVSVATSRAHLDGFWFTAWTKQQGMGFTTEATSIVCLSPGLCTFAAACGEAQTELENLRNIKLVTYHRLSDPNTVAHQALVASVVDVAHESTAVALVVQRLSVGQADAGLQSEEVGALQLAESDLTHGTNWPELAVIAPDKVVASWIEYGASMDTLHVERYRICYSD